MRLPFEQWTADQPIPQPAKELFAEAIVCYKAAAYRAALLFSYLGFQTTVRDRILRSKQPSNITDGNWQRMQGEIRDDDSWDSAVYDAIQQRSPREVFILSEDLRNQITFFKNRRNDCAHGKSNKIDYSHVETFWLFIQSHLSKFVVNESREDLTNRIRDHFDRSITPPGEDYSHIVREIPSAVEQSRLIDFFEEVHQILSSPTSRLFPGQRDEAQFFNRILDLQNEGVSAKLVEYLEQNEELLTAILQDRPERVIHFRGNAALLRKLWYEELFSSFGHDSDLAIFCAMLRNDLIPQSQRSEAIAHIVRKLRDQIPSESCYEILDASGFFAQFKAMVFEDRLLSRFNWANSNTNLIVYYLDRFEIDDVVAHAVADTFSVPNYPYELQKALNAYFAEKHDKRGQLLRLIQDNDYPFPEKLDVLNDAEDGT